MSHVTQRGLWASGLIAALVGGCGDLVLNPIESSTSESTGGSSAVGGSETSGGTPASGGDPTSSGGQPGTGGADPTECALTPSDKGWVNANTNPCGMQGSWYAYNDCKDSPDDCTKNQLPVEGKFPNENGRMCTTGITAIPANSEEISTKWGAGIGVPLNQYVDQDMAMHPVGELDIWNTKRIFGMRFVLEIANPDQRILVNFPTAATQETAHLKEVRNTAPGAQEHVVLFSEAVQPGWVPEDERIELDPRDIIKVQFQVPTEIGREITFDFCVGALTILLTDP